MGLDISTLLGAGVSLLSGGATGLLGAVFSNLTDIWKNKQKLDFQKAQWAHDVDMKNADAAIMREEWAKRSEIAATEADATKDAAKSEAFAKSFSMEPASYSAGIKAPEGNLFADVMRALGWLTMVTLDAIRGSVRPGLTIYLCWLTAAIYEEAKAAILLHGNDPVLMGEVYKNSVYTILYLFMTCLLWWFGTRNTQQAPKAAGK